MGWEPLYTPVMSQPTRIQFTPPAIDRPGSTGIGASIAVAVLFVGGLLVASYPVAAVILAFAVIVVQVARRLLTKVRHQESTTRASQRERGTDREIHSLSD